MASRARVRAPELIGRGGWLNTGGTDLTLTDLRGRIVILDFWTFCCVNCLHVLDELRELEEKHHDTVVIVGVHSPKFVHEAEHQAVVDAVERYEVHHPVLDDPELATWKQYAVRAWPTLVVIDPEGYVVAQHAGEGHAHALETLVAQLEAEHAAKGTLRRGDGPYAHPSPDHHPSTSFAPLLMEPVPPSSASPVRRCCCPAAPSSSRTPPAISWWSSRRTARAWCGGSARASAALTTARASGPGSASPRGSPCSPTAPWPSPTP
ncbi:hypothetical protein GCM10022420_046650 [Streptomyces iranensis]|uniref:Redoxin domain protein n=1 Tax=Streptomyces iranensis TaxID=576784 RepID=A0A060ZXZ4_9ACTN|nr:thiol-disulfide isomerase/thioredoxin [Streptomyces iranensis]CDR08333.1 Redoxin domain protein [Streptomyces iranensis]